MKAENSTTDHNRTINLTEIGYQNGLQDMQITINYKTSPNDGNALDKAVTLDNCVIPAIILALNYCYSPRGLGMCPGKYSGGGVIEYQEVDRAVHLPY